jgi:hypothetical protein
MIPEPIKSLISPVIGTLEDFKTIVYDALKDAGTVASTAASALSQLIAIATTFKTSITNLIPGVGGLVDLVLDVLSKVASSAQDVATCLGAPKNCNGLLVILGYILKAALPLIKSQVAGLGSLGKLTLPLHFFLQRCFTEDHRYKNESGNAKPFYSLNRYIIS